MTWPKKLYVTRLFYLFLTWLSPSWILFNVGTIQTVFAEIFEPPDQGAETSSGTPGEAVVQPQLPPSSEVKLLLEGLGVPGLHWSTDPIEFKKEKSKGEVGYFVNLRGTFNEPHTDLLWNMRRIVSTESKVPQEFEVKVQVSSTATLLRVRSINARGEIYKSTYVISIPDYQRRTVVLNTKSNLRASASMGYSTIQYQEGRAISLSMTGVTVKGTVQYQIVPKEWDIALNCYVTALPISQNLTPATRFLGANARVGYILPEPGPPWTVGIMGGIYYTTMIVAKNAFGFSNLMGPQLFPTVRYQLGANSAIGAYFKYSPILTSNGLLPFSQRELAVGLNYTYLMEDGHPLSGSLDIADLRMTADNLPIVSTSISFSIGYGF